MVIVVCFMRMRQKRRSYGFNVKMVHVIVGTMPSVLVSVMTPSQNPSFATIAIDTANCFHVGVLLVA